MANRVILGQYPTGEYVLRVSRPGYNVLSDAIPLAGIAFDSRWDDSARIYQQGTVTLPNAAAGAMVKIANWVNLTYVPAVLFTYQQVSDDYDFDIRRRGIMGQEYFIVSRADGLYCYYNESLSATGAFRINYVCLMGAMT